MGFLGLDQTEVKDDNLFQRLFWPSDHAGETDTLGQQGFWLCLGVALVSSAALAIGSHWVLALLTLAFFGLGGVGVREHSQPTAVLVAIVYLLGVLAPLFLGIPPGALQIIASLLLLANIRGTFIAARWASRDASAMPERMNATFTDKLVDQMPARVWPAAKIPFFCIAGIYVVISVFGTVLLAAHVPQRLQSARPNPPSVTLQVSPSR